MQLAVKLFRRYVLKCFLAIYSDQLGRKMLSLACYVAYVGLDNENVKNLQTVFR